MKPLSPKAEKLWGGRFRQPTAAAFEQFSESFSFDRRLAWAEVRGTRAHAAGLRRAGVLSAPELESLYAALDQLEAALRQAPPQPQPGMEDVHTYVFQRLRATAGEVALKLQTGRSRNEQVALDLRLYCRDQRLPLLHAIGRLLAALASFAREHAAVLIPGYTHLQRAQPVSLGHHALAYAEMLLRDAERFRDAYQRLDACPLGSGALAGTPWKAYDRDAAARDLGFTRVAQNSLDAVSDRDFAVELVFASSLMAVHLSRWAEDWILYSSSEFGWLKLGDQYATGSSLMPQKKNPDGLELLRGKAARQLGSLMQLLVLLKGLPLAYNRDLQEDKEPVFETLDTALAALEIAAGIVATTSVDAVRAAAAVSDQVLLATDLADRLVQQGVPFHEAHKLVGDRVTAYLERGEPFAPPSAGGSALTPQTSVALRDSVGGTAPTEVERQAARISAEAHRLLA